MDQNEIIADESHFTFYLPGINAIASTGPARVGRPAEPIQKLDGASGEIAPWGSDNAFPQNVIADIEKNSLLRSTLEWKAKALYSGGVVYGIVTVDDEGNETFKRIYDEEIENFILRSKIGRYGIEAAVDLYTFYNVFPELIVSNDRKTITGLSVYDASYCRWSKQNAKGYVEKCFINANWNNGANIENSVVRPVLDIYYDGAEKLKVRKDGFSFIYPLSFPTPGKSLYQLASWNAVRQSGWLDVANAIPKFKSTLLKNQVTIKYHIQVADTWWEWKFPTWKSMSKEEQISAKKAEFKMFSDFVSGHENAGKFLLSSFKTDPVSGKTYDGWRITAVDDKIKDGIYIEDGQEANSNIINSLGVDNTLIQTPGKGMGGGSGSDKLVAYQVYNALNKAENDIIMEPLQFISEYNGWLQRHKGLTWTFKNSLIGQSQVKPMRQLQPQKENNGTN